MKYLSSLLLLLLCLLAGCSNSPKDPVRADFDKGLAQLERGELAKADSTFRKIMTESPTSPLGLYGTGLVLEHEGQVFDALGVYLQVNKLERTFSPSLFSMGRAFRNLGEYDLAAAAYIEASKLPDSAGLALVRVASVRCDDRQSALALAALRIADTTDADKAMIQLVRARVYAQQMQFDSADALFASAIGRGETPLPLTQLAADFLEDRGLIDSSIMVSSKSLEGGAASRNDMYPHFKRALRHNYFWQARQAAARLSGADTSSLAYFGLQVQYGLAAGDTPLASRARNKFMRKGRNSVTTYVYDADVCVKFGDMASVTHNIGLIPKLAIEGNDTTAFAKYLEGMVLLRYAATNDDPELAASLARTSGWASDRRDFILQYLQQFVKAGAIEPYQQSMKTIEAAHGNEADWLTGIGDIWADRGVRQFDSAAAFYRRALKVDSTYWPAVRNFTSTCMSLGEYKRALEFFESYQSLVAAYPELALDRSICLVHAGEVDRGYADFQAALPKAKGDIGRVEIMSRLLEAKGKVDADGGLIRLMLMLDEKNPDALLLASTRDNDYNNFESAFETAERGLALEPTNPDLQVQRARAMYKRGDKAAAKAQLRSILKSNSNLVSANLYLSALMAADMDSVEVAQNFARAAVLWENGSRRAINNLAIVYMQSNRPDLAAGDLGLVLPLHQDWADTRYLMGIAQFAMNNKQLARQYLESAVELGIPSGYRQKATELLEKL
jgi:tetratricopeptide (TPR) repeat protein